MIQSLGRRCHAAAAARRHTAYPSAKNTLRLRRNCFFGCGARCAAATHASALPVTLRALRDGQRSSGAPPRGIAAAASATNVPPARLLTLRFRLRGALCGCSARLRASCHAAGWAHGRVAKRPFREKCRWASPSLFFRLHVLLAPLCAYPPRFLSRCAPSAAGNYSLLRQKCRWPAASLFFGLRSSLLPCSRALRASTYTYPKSGRPGRG